MSNDRRKARLNELAVFVNTGSTFINGLNTAEYDRFRALFNTFIPLEDVEESDHDLDLAAYQIAYVEAVDRVVRSLSALILEYTEVDGAVSFIASRALLIIELLARCRDVHTIVAAEHIELALDDITVDMVLDHILACDDFPWERFQLDPMIAEEHAELVRRYPELKGRQLATPPQPLRLIDRYCDLFALENMTQIIEAIWFDEGISAPERKFLLAAVRILQIRLAADSKEVFQQIADRRAEEDAESA